jgi:hypothetical protein
MQKLFSLPDKLTNDGCTLTDVKAPDEHLEPIATSNIFVNINLNANDMVPDAPFDRKRQNIPTL